jgi:hypothetical protein
MIIITFESRKKVVVPEEIFKRILSCAYFYLDRLKASEGPQFPALDREAQKAIENLSFEMDGRK